MNAEHIYILVMNAVHIYILVMNAVHIYILVMNAEHIEHCHYTFMMFCSRQSTTRLCIQGKVAVDQHS